MGMSGASIFRSAAPRTTLMPWWRWRFSAIGRMRRRSSTRNFIRPSRRRSTWASSTGSTNKRPSSMNGYLMQEAEWTPGGDLFLECFSPENSFGVVFEDDGDTAYFYAVEKNPDGGELRILDA